MLKLLRQTSVVIAGAIAVASPAQACTDWRAVATFDQIQIGVIMEMWKKDRARDEILTEAMRWAVIHREAAMADQCPDVEWSISNTPPKPVWPERPMPGSGKE